MNALTGAIAFDFDPLLPLSWITLALAVAAALTVLGHARRKTSVWRWTLLAVVAVALMQPSLRQLEKKPLSDVAVVLVDDSPSQQLGERPAQMEAARKKLLQQLARQPNLDVITARLSDSVKTSPMSETPLFGALREQLALVQPERLAGAIVLTDGRAHDMPAELEKQPDALRGLGFARPVHVLLSGSRKDRDRRIEIVNAPKFGMVGNDVAIAVKAVCEPECAGPAVFTVRKEDAGEQTFTAQFGETVTFALHLAHAGHNLAQVSLSVAPGELTAANNQAVVSVSGVRDRLRVLLVTGKVYPGQRVWRNLLKSDPGIDLVHFNILRDFNDDDSIPNRELSLIPFPVHQLFGARLSTFDLVIIDDYSGQTILPAMYLDNIANYVRRGGAFLYVADPTFEKPSGLMASRLADILPVRPSGQVTETPFKPALTDAGKRHPVTAPFAGSEPHWGAWNRLIGADPAQTATVVLNGAQDQPLLVLGAAEHGRVAALLSDQIWLWAHGVDGGGPHAELARRIIHWLLKEPELEEVRIHADAKEDTLSYTRHSVALDSAVITIKGPNGYHASRVMTPNKAGIISETLSGLKPGVYSIGDGEHAGYAAVGGQSAREYAEVTATPAVLAPLSDATGGGVYWLEDGVPSLRRVGVNGSAAGSGWLGLKENHYFAITGETRIPLVPAWVLFGLLLAALVLTWRAEGKV